MGRGLGANAAGKSALVEGLEALRSLVLTTRPVGAMLRLTPHLLRGKGRPTSFLVEFVTAVRLPDGGEKEQVFLYELSADRKRVHREALLQVNRTEEVFLFERDGDQVHLYGSLEENELARAHVTVLAANQTLLGALGPDIGGPTAAAWQWFERLTVIRPSYPYLFLPERITADAVFASAMSAGLTRADTGISELRLQEVKVSALPVPAEVVDDLVESLRETGGSCWLSQDYTVLSVNDDGEPVARRLVADHRRETGPDEQVSFTLPLHEESDGTQRFMNLLPILFQLRQEDARRVFVVDELENSMHPKLTESLVAAFLDDLGPHDRRQLIFTTHELQLMRSDLLRRDEIWLADKTDGQSSLTRVSDFAEVGVRKDADLLGFYMSGRIGGIPRV